MDTFTHHAQRCAMMIGNVELSNRVFIAPMEDVTNPAYRRIVREIANPGLMYSEFVSAMANHYNPDRARKKMFIHPDEHPLAIQIFGGECESMADAARTAEASGADIVDINMGCWVPKVCRTGSGAALMKDPEKACEIVKAVINAVSVPVTVKVRAGWTYGLFAAPDLVKKFQDIGAQAITLHARYVTQGFTGEADWKLIEEMREAVQVPLIGNGDIKTPEDATNILNQTGCDAVMIGRAAIANPWSIRNIVGHFEGLPMSPISLRQRIETALRHIQYMIEYESKEGGDRQEAEDRACRALRGQIPLYLKAFQGANELRKSLQQCRSYHDYASILLPYLAQFEADNSLQEPDFQTVFTTS